MFKVFVALACCVGSPDAFFPPDIVPHPTPPWEQPEDPPDPDDWEEWA